jgi:hypothetical protein
MPAFTARMADAIVAGAPRGLFAAIEHPNGTAYFCTGVGSRVWNGQTWQGVGNLASVTPVKRTSEISIQDITFRLSGVDPEIVARLDDDVRNLNGSVWLACFDENDNVIPDPYRLVDSELDFQIYTVDADGTASIEIVAHSGFYTLDRGVDEAFTPENQKLTYPTDTGLDLIPGLQKKDLQWTPS